MERDGQRETKSHTIANEMPILAYQDLAHDANFDLSTDISCN
jgi:hypothetical protein